MHYWKVVRQDYKARLYSKRAAILGNAKIRFTLGHGTQDFEDGMKNMEIAARKCHKRAMKCLREACRHGNFEKSLFLDIVTAGLLSHNTHTQKSIPEQTRRVTTIPRPLLESSWQGELISFEYKFF